LRVECHHAAQPHPKALKGLHPKPRFSSAQMVQPISKTTEVSDAEHQK
jgi:hypothetical protein